MATLRVRVGYDSQLLKSHSSGRINSYYFWDFVWSPFCVIGSQLVSTSCEKMNEMLRLASPAVPVWIGQEWSPFTAHCSCSTPYCSRQLKCKPTWLSNMVLSCYSGKQTVLQWWAVSRFESASALLFFQVVYGYCLVTLPRSINKTFIVFTAPRLNTKSFLVVTVWCEA